MDAETVTREATERVFAGTIGALEMDDDARDRLAASLAAVLNAKEGPGTEVKARAFVARAVLALRGRPADADGAKELIAVGKKLVNGFAEPHLLRVAEARLALVREIDAAGGADVNAAREAHEASIAHQLAVGPRTRGRRVMLPEANPGAKLCGNQTSGAPRHRRDVVLTNTTARWHNLAHWFTTHRCETPGADGLAR